MGFSRRKGAIEETPLNIGWLLIGLVILLFVFSMISAALNPSISVIERTGKILDCMKLDISSCAGLLSFSGIIS